MVKKLNKFLLLVTAFLFMGCAINYEDQSDEIKKSDAIPDSVMKNFNLIQIKNNKPYTIISSSSTEIYDTLNKTILFDVEFSEYNTTTSKLATKGRADTIEYYNDTEDAKLKGNLNFISTKNELEMTGEYLYWNKEDKRVESSADSSILVVKDDGSRIEGYGFAANLRNSTFSFDKNVTGVTK